MINKEVPKSGCFITKATGTSKKILATTKSVTTGLLSRLEKYQASIIGMAIRITSEGCILVNPKLSQRCAP